MHNYNVNFPSFLHYELWKNFHLYWSKCSISLHSSVTNKQPSELPYERISSLKNANMKACVWRVSSLSCYKNYIFNTAKMFRYELLTTATYNQSPGKCGILKKHDKEVKFYFSVHADLSVTDYLIYGLHTWSCVWNGTPSTRSPFVPCLHWLAVCSRWKFLWDMAGVHQIHT